MSRLIFFVHFLEVAHNVPNLSYNMSLYAWILNRTEWNSFFVQNWKCYLKQTPQWTPHPSLQNRLTGLQNNVHKQIFPDRTQKIQSGNEKVVVLLDFSNRVALHLMLHSCHMRWMGEMGKNSHLIDILLASRRLYDYRVGRVRIKILRIDTITPYPVNLSLITLADVRLPYLFCFQALPYY